MPRSFPFDSQFTFCRRPLQQWNSAPRCNIILCKMEQKEPLGSKLSPRLASYQILDDGQQTTVTQGDASAVNANGKKHKCTRLCRLCCCCCCCGDENEDADDEDIDLAWERYQKNVPLIMVSSPRNTRPNSNAGDYDTFASTLDLKDVLLATDSSDSSKINPNFDYLN